MRTRTGGCTGTRRFGDNDAASIDADRGERAAGATGAGAAAVGVAVAGFLATSTLSTFTDRFLMTTFPSFRSGSTVGSATTAATFDNDASFFGPAFPLSIFSRF